MMVALRAFLMCAPSEWLLRSEGPCDLRSTIRTMLIRNNKLICKMNGVVICRNGRRYKEKSNLIRWCFFTTTKKQNRLIFSLTILFLKNGPTRGSFLFIFGLFQTNIITIFTTD